MRKELVASIRNNIVLYMLLFTLLISIAMGLFLPGMEGMKLTLAVDAGVSLEVREGLSRYGTVEVFDEPDLVRQRVGKPDDVPGIIVWEDAYRVILEGNEGEEAEGVAAAILHSVLQESGGVYEYIPTGRTGSALRQAMAALLGLMAALMGGFVIGLNIVAEREGRSIRALAVSPIKTREMVIGHILLCMMIGIVVALISIGILAGAGINYGRVVLVAAAGSITGTLLGYLIGAFADNLLSAIIVIKVLMLFFLGIPMGSLAVPQNVHWVFYPFPHYWIFSANLRLMGYQVQHFAFPVMVLLAILISTICLAAVVLLYKKRLNLR